MQSSVLSIGLLKGGSLPPSASSLPSLSTSYYRTHPPTLPFPRNTARPLTPNFVGGRLPFLVSPWNPSCVYFSPQGRSAPPVTVFTQDRAEVRSFSLPQLFFVSDLYFPKPFAGNSALSTLPGCLLFSLPPCLSFSLFPESNQEDYCVALSRVSLSNRIPLMS